MAASEEDVGTFSRAARARWESPRWAEVRMLARSRRILALLAEGPITAEQAAQVRALLPPASEDGRT
jgi:hypothetical protein